jgi:RNA polymerase sigma-70 factor (ECF subfamily)
MNQDDFEALYRASAGALRLYLRRACGGDRQLADDVIQEAFLRLLGAKQPPAGLEDRVRYLYGIASNLMKDHWRRSRQAANRESAPAVAAAPAPPAAEGKDAALDLQAALARLEPRARQILWLAYAEGYSHAEMAEILGYRPASIRVLLFRARRKILRELGDLDVAERRPGGGDR